MKADGTVMGQDRMNRKGVMEGKDGRKMEGRMTTGWRPDEAGKSGSEDAGSSKGSWGKMMAKMEVKIRLGWGWEQVGEG